MLAIAKKENADSRFVHGDMRRFSVRKGLRPGGILLFDDFDARTIFHRLHGRPKEHIRPSGSTLDRVSKNSPNLATGWTWNWDARYEISDGKRKRRFRDRSILRAFTPDELRLCLLFAGFETMRISRESAILFTLARKS